MFLDLLAAHHRPLHVCGRLRHGHQHPRQDLERRRKLGTDIHQGDQRVNVIVTIMYCRFSPIFGKYLALPLLNEMSSGLCSLCPRKVYG
jgi:hypothetical protein